MMFKEDLEQSRPKPELEKQKLEQEKLTQEKECPESKEQEKQRKRKKSSRMFWGTIIVLLVVYFSVKFFAYSEPSQETKTARTQKIIKPAKRYIEKFLPTDIIKDNLNNHQSKINVALNSGIEEMNGKINTQIDGFFDQVENNVGKFLDWHYSLKGNYSELALFVAKKLGLSVEDALFNKLQEKFLGTDYKQRLKTMTDNISDAFISLLRQHKKDTEKIATQGVAGIPQVVESLKNIDDRTERDLKLKMGFAAAIGATAGVGAGKLMKRLVPKLVEKLGTKLGAKFLAKFGIAVGGVLSTLGADVAFNYIDEWLHRDDFKKEILNNINEMKKNLKESYKTGFDNSITKFSQEFQKDLKNIETISVKAYVEKLK
ncbi:hypothetical protein TH0071_01170 [Helicobacter pylori]